MRRFGSPEDLLGIVLYLTSDASSYHTGGANAVTADGSVRFVRETIDFPTWQAMGSRAGGEVVALD